LFCNLFFAVFASWHWHKETPHMTRKITYKIVASALSLAMLAALASDAFAGWRWHGSSGGSSGGYGSSGGWGGSSGGWGGGSSGGWGGSSGGGSSGGWGGWGWKKHRWFRGHGSSGGWGGSSGGWDGGWGSSGGSSGGWGGSYYSPSDYGGKVIDPGMSVPADPTIPSNPPPPPGTPQETSHRRADGLLAVSVPEDAKVFVNGLPTSSKGAERQYVSRDLQGGYNYTYEVKAEIVRDGKTIEQVKQVNLRAGQTAELAFNFPASESLETSLTVNVPEGAKVYLAGNPTNAKGPTRVFRTTGLSAGKAWDDYTVRVEFERDGQVVSEEKTIRLTAGQSQELTFDFPTDQVASR
jgi:uncharacterized protein (TIGR03000 family)